ncbi:TraC family protein, partial [Enterobacter hormaechei]|uniref:TraC family protein n=1 Tax=Enterobacter hormaechei TaxID=158836 RepID=UPI001EF77433
MSKPGGLFTDTQVTGQPWRGQPRRVRACIYRRIVNAVTETTSCEEQLEQVAMTLMSTFNEAGIAAKRCT